MRDRAAGALLVSLLLTSLLLSGAAQAAAVTVLDDGAVGGQRSDKADPTDRFIVVLRPDSDATKARDRQMVAAYIKPDHVYKAAFKGYAAKLTAGQRLALGHDPDVAAIVPDEVVEVAGQLLPTGVSRISGTMTDVAGIDGVDERVDADVAIVDTGIDATQPDLNVVGGQNCSTSDPTAWRDRQGHGTHVAGTVGAIDNGQGVVGVAPGVRLWAVKILDDTGTGLLSWYVCGLDWIASQRDPDDPDKPLIEAVNMSVTKWGKDDHACGSTIHDILHAAICRLVASGVTVVAAAANDSGPASSRVPAAYDEVITVSALADTDGKDGGHGGHRCWSWGGYDWDDTFADFSNYGSDVDLIAPGKCIWSTLPGNKYGYLSGTSMAAPHVTGAVALYKQGRPWATPADVKDALVALASFRWSTGTDPDGHPDPLLSVARIGSYGDFDIGTPATDPVVTTAGRSFPVPIEIERSSTFVERVSLSATVVPEDGLSFTFTPASTIGIGATSATLTIKVSNVAAPGRYDIVIKGSEHGRARTATLAVDVLPTTRLAGPDRFGTAAAISAATFDPGVKTAYIASAYDFPDALAGAAAAGTANGPVLLTAADGPIDPATVAELKRLDPARIVVLGGTGVISKAVATALRTYAPRVTRLAGPDRFGTAAAISAATFDPGVKTAYIASAYDFPDALAGAAAAGTANGPVLLTAADGPIDPATVAELKRLDPARIVVLGGTGVISKAVATALRTYAPRVTRLAGPDRFGTAAAISAATFDPGVKTAYIASAYDFPDALAGAAAAGTANGPVLLTAADGPIDPATVAELKRLDPARIVVLGGTGVISDPVLLKLAAYSGD